MKWKDLFEFRYCRTFMRSVTHACEVVKYFFIESFDKHRKTRKRFILNGETFFLNSITLRSWNYWPHNSFRRWPSLFIFTDSRNQSFIRDSYQDDDRRSHSLDGDLILGPNLLQQFEKGKNKSAWSKVKGIVTNRSSRKSVKSTGSMNSRDVSPIEVLDAHRDRTDSLSSSNQPSPSHIGGFNLSIPDYDFGGTSSGYSNYQMSSDDNELKAFDSKQVKSHWQGKKTLGSRKSKHVPEIESLLEGVPLESNFNKKQIPYPLNLQKVRIPLKAPRKHFLKLFLGFQRIWWLWRIWQLLAMLNNRENSAKNQRVVRSEQPIESFGVLLRKRLFRLHGIAAEARLEQLFKVLATTRRNHEKLSGTAAEDQLGVWEEENRVGEDSSACDSIE